MIEAVIFDWGGTLSIYADIDLADMWRMAARHLSPDHEDAMTARLVQVETDAWDRIKVDQHSFTLAQLLVEASEAVGLDVAAAVLEEASRHHLDAWTPHIRHDPDAVGVLEELQSRGMKVGLLSNTHWPREFHEHFLDRDGLSSLIDARLYTSELDHSKPHPSVFVAALRATGVSEPSHAVFVGDRPYDDVWGAQQAGLKGVLRSNDIMPAYDVEPDGVIDSLPELLALVDGWGDSC
ncbi:MAG TPA: HAD family hydrolase [Acidimicrobiales bacterium]